MTFLPINFVLIDTKGELCTAWKEEFAALPPEVLSRFTFLTTRLDELPAPHDKFDCIVSPANSYGIMDGGFDLYLSKAFQPPGGDYTTLTRHVQATLYDRFLGYIPPGSCTIVDLRESEMKDNPFGANSIAVLPTMRIPENVEWDKDIVYHCMWNLLVQLARHASDEANSRNTNLPPIRTVVMTGLATGVGRISIAKCAAQMALAVKHFAQARSSPERYSKMNWRDVSPLDTEIDKTRKL